MILCGDLWFWHGNWNSSRQEDVIIIDANIQTHTHTLCILVLHLAELLLKKKGIIFSRSKGENGCWWWRVRMMCWLLTQVCYVVVIAAAIIIMKTTCKCHTTWRSSLTHLSQTFIHTNPVLIFCFVFIWPSFLKVCGDGAYLMTVRDEGAKFCFTFTPKSKPPLFKRVILIRIMIVIHFSSKIGW